MRGVVPGAEPERRGGVWAVVKPADLPELGVVRTASPCDVPWESMRGDAVKRYCGKCRLHVWNFSELSSEEARALLLQTQGRLCARIYTRADGSVLTRDCPRGLARVKRMAAAPFVAVAAWLVAAAVAIVLLWKKGEPACAAPPLKGMWMPPAVAVRAIKSGNPRGAWTTGIGGAPRMPAMKGELVRE